MACGAFLGPDKVKRFWRIVAHAGSVRTVAGSIGGCLMMMAYSYFTAAPPIRIMSETQQERPIIRGGRLELTVHTQVSGACPFQTDRNLWRIEHRGPAGDPGVDGPVRAKWAKGVRIVIPLPVTSTVISHPGENHYVLSLPLPEGIGVGTWNYLVRTRPLCGVLHGLFEPSPLQSADIPIEIRDPTILDIQGGDAG